MKKFLVLFSILISSLFLVLGEDARAATYTSVKTGNWTDSASWIPSGVPGIGDTVIINGGYVITVNSDVTIGTGSATAITVGSGTTAGTIIIGTNRKLTLNGNMLLGTGSGRDGTFTMSPGSTLDRGVFQLLLGNSSWNTTGNLSNNRALVTGTGSITSALIVGPRQDINLSYVDFRGSGSIKFSLEDSVGAITSSLNLAHDTFVSTGQVIIGTSLTPLSADRIVEYSDFRDLGQVNTAIIRFGGAAGNLTGAVRFRYNTFSLSSGFYNILSGTNVWNGMDFSYNILKNIKFIAPGDATVRYNFSNLHPSNGAVAFSFIPGANGSSIDHNYLYYEAGNNHGMTFGGGGNTGINNVTDNIIENKNPGDHNTFIAGSQNRNTLRNILIGTGQLEDLDNSASSPNTLNVKNNTIYYNVPFSPPENQADFAQFYMNETGTNAVAFTINIANNLASYAPGIAIGRNCSLVLDMSNPYDTVNYLGYNYSKCPLLGKGGIIIRTAENNNVGASSPDPNFYDPTRNIAKWDALLGGPGTSAHAVDELLKRNGYGGTWNASYNLDSLLTYVRAGFSPQNAALKGAGQGGADIGAVPVLALPDITPPQAPTGVTVN